MSIQDVDGLYKKQIKEPLLGEQENVSLPAEAISGSRSNEENTSVLAELNSYRNAHRQRYNLRVEEQRVREEQEYERQIKADEELARALEAEERQGNPANVQTNFAASEHSGLYDSQNDVRSPMRTGYTERLLPSADTMEHVRSGHGHNFSGIVAFGSTGLKVLIFLLFVGVLLFMSIKSLQTYS